ncbi:MAG: hypothetical protein KDH15_05885 [Rhodocyclaceae bacterium]|nr:hypothetical protein [Rhodocyclaceae bacterium]
MSDTDSALALPWDSSQTSLVLTRESTEAWPNIQPLFAVDGYFPNGLTIRPTRPVSSSAREVLVTGTAAIHASSFAVEARFHGSGRDVDLEITVSLTLARLAGEGSALRGAWQPAVTFKSNRGRRTIDLQAARGTIHVAGVTVAAQLTTPGLLIEATIAPDDKSLSSIAGAFAFGNVGRGLMIEQMRLRADPWRGVYSVALDAGGNWKILGRCSLTRIAALILYASEANTAWASMRASVTLGGVELQVMAAYDGSVSGWQFEGGIAPDRPLEIAGFVDSLLAQLAVKGSCPEALKGATIDELFASFNTASKAFVLRCETRLAVNADKVLDVTLLIDVEDGRMSFRGTVTLGSLEFDLVFDETKSHRMLVASFVDQEPNQVVLGDLIAMVSDDRRAIAAGNELAFSIKSALFACEKHDDAPSRWLLAADVEAGMDLSGLPLVGASFPPGQGARLLFQPLLTSGGIDSAALGDLVRAGAVTLPPTPPAEGLSLTTRLSLGSEVIRLGLPVHISDGKMAHDPGGAPAAEPPGVTTIDNVSWIAVQKAFGPLAVERVGIRYDKGMLDLLLDAQLRAAGLTLALEGFGARVNIADPSQVTPTLDGIGIDLRSPSIEIGGTLVRQTVVDSGNTFDEYVGTALVKAGALAIDAMGSYRVVDGHPSLFVYAALDYPIGGPSFFFVTGLAAAFGYNRAFKAPPIDRLAAFPLLAADAAGKGARSAKDLRATSDALREYIPAEVGAIFLCAGLKFSSFQTIASSALLTASFGKNLALDLIGRSTLIMPAGATREQAVAFVEMAWRSSYRPAEGLLALQAQLSPESYIFARDCHVAGGFAFYSWFSGEHAGDFVVTAGGYHPAFDLARRPHYPRLPRLSVAWQVNDALSIKGDAYYALTSSAAMAGGHLELVWERHPYKAWCKAGIDCLFEWKPIHYQGEAHVELGASYTFEFAGTRHITVEVGADLTIWGPPFSGLARVNLVLFSFDVSFGKPQVRQAPVHLFDDDGEGHGTGFSALLPAANQLCAVSVRGGSSGTIESEGEKVWLVNPKELCLVVDSVIPSKEILVKGLSQDPSNGAMDPPARFGIAPMAVGHDELASTTTITITKIGDSRWKPDHLQYRLRTKGFPAALWGEPGKAAPTGRPSEEDPIEALAGVVVSPKRVAGAGASTAWHDVHLVERHRPLLRDGTYELHVTQHLSAKSPAERHGGACCKPLVASAALRFRVAGERSGLPASCIHSVFPPKGSLGDHATTLPQIILERSTLPWERSADLPGADLNTPWLALLVFDGEKKATVHGSPDGAPGTATIDVDEKDLPSVDELRLLCHVRVVRVRDPDGGERMVERAVVVAGRTPTAGKLSTAHLVSMNAMERDGARCRVLSLWNWSFACSADEARFGTLINRLAKKPFDRGSVRLRHSLASGKRAEADYRGPLRPWPRGADGEPDTSGRSGQMPDISYAAALELGRLLALQNKAISVALLRLKRRLSHEARLDSQIEAAEHLYPRSMPLAELVQAPSGRLLPVDLQRLLTAELAAWAEGLLTLEGVPFRYLFPDEKLLPKESIRSFELDQQWLANLLVGALGVGGVWHLGAKARRALPDFEPAFRVGKGPIGKGETPFGALPKLTGVVLRSQVVSAWPAFSVYADEEGSPLLCRRLSNNILLALFAGTIRTVTFRLARESLHLESTSGAALPRDWLRDAKTSVELGGAVKFATQEEVSWTV